MTTTQFLSTIGVNTHIATGVANYESGATDLTDLRYPGAANVRDSYNPSNESVYTALGQAGIKFDLETYAGGHLTTSSLQSELSSFHQLNSAAPGMVAALERPNEINNWPVTYNGATSLNSAVAYQQVTSACTNATPNHAASAGGFGTHDGQIYSPNGDPFIARGVNVMYGNGNPSAAQLQADFPGINYVRLAIYNYDSPAALTAYVDDLTSHGIVVELENHNNGAGNAGGNQGTIFTGAALAQEQAWYSAVAAAFKTNPYVWFGTNNEPSEVNANGQTDPAALSAWQQQTYQTIRSAGNNSPVLLEANSWGPGKTNVGYTASDYAGMTNVIWDLHYYGWLSRYSTDQSTVSSTLAGMIADTAAIQSADAKIPVLIGEYGNSTTGQAIDANGNQVVTAVQQSGVGSAAWAWGSGNPGDGLTNGNGGVSAYGQQVAAFTAGSGAAGCAQSPIPSPAPVPAPASHGAVAPPAPATPNAAGQTPASADVVSPGQGSATDAQGNTYAIAADGSVLENGNTWLPGGGGTSQLVIVERSDASDAEGGSGTVDCQYPLGLHRRPGDAQRHSRGL
nr:cellulase family glycosylhydrolase [uncultured Rhodopila sp.]